MDPIVLKSENKTKLKCSQVGPIYLHIFILSLIYYSLVSSAYAQTTLQPSPKSDTSKEAFVVELDSTKIAFENDGSSTREYTGRVRIQSDAGVQRYGLLAVPYQDAYDQIDVDYVRVNKPGGAVVITPGTNIQDVASEITRMAPLYSDLREKHIPVTGLGVGDILEFRFHWHSKPLVPGQFWYAFNFSHDAVVLKQELQISMPVSRVVKWRSPKLKPSIIENGTRKIFTWTSSQLEPEPAEQTEQAEKIYQVTRGQLPSAEVQISSFQSWEDVARWYGSLQQERVKPTAEIQSKAAELTKNAGDEDAKLRSIYSYVSTQFRYIGVDFGTGRYQPHSAAEVLRNQFGDCKDKHTLLASLLDAAGIKAYPALISYQHEIDADLPSPGQFDHVITYVPQGTQFHWLDTTSEVAPFGLLLSPLRNKHALVIPENSTPALMTTPADPPNPALQTFQIDAKLEDTGTLQGKVERTFQGASEVAIRSAFRRLPLSQWKTLIQQISYASGFAGDVSEVGASPPEKVDGPFRFSYNYTRKDYPRWSDREIQPPLPAVALPIVTDNDSKNSHPVWLGPPGETRLQSRVELPKGYTAELPRNIDLQEDFAEYHSSYSIKDGALVTDRRLIVKLREVPAAKNDAYKAFNQTVADDKEQYIPLSTGRRSEKANSYQNEIWQLPYSKNPEASRAYDDARDYYQKNNPQAEIGALKRAVDIDPMFTRAWLWLGEIYKSRRQLDMALQAYRKAIEVDPQKTVSYKALGFTLMVAGRFEEALPVWEKLTKIAPDDFAALESLGACLQFLKRYGESASVLESAVTLNPQRMEAHMQLGSAYLRAGNEEKALAEFRKVLELDSRPRMFNDVAYELADTNRQLPMALEYAERAVREEEEASQKMKLSTLQVDDLKHTTSLAAFWDTLGWVHFRLAHFDQAEKYVNSSWALSQHALVADHLGQIYEKQNKTEAAIHAYRLALAASSGSSFDKNFADEVQKRLEALGASAGKPLYGAYPGGDELSRMRTIKLPLLFSGTASAEVFLLLVPGPKVQDVKFISGWERFKSSLNVVASASISQPFPDQSKAQLIRRGIVGCYNPTGCSLVLLPPESVHSIN